MRVVVPRTSGDSCQCMPEPWIIRPRDQATLIYQQCYQQCYPVQLPRCMVSINSIDTHAEQISHLKDNQYSVDIVTLPSPTPSRIPSNAQQAPRFDIGQSLGV